jgi:hypothetical protein
MSRTLEERFWDKVDIQGPDDCWEWTASTHYRKGYGQFWAGGTMQLAHRYAYYLATGEKPGELCVLHTCDNPPCCNPAHLWLGTVADNNRDMADKDRAAKGEDHGSSKLTERDIQEIRDWYEAGELQKDIAATYGISRRQVSRIVNKKNWGWLC